MTANSINPNAYLHAETIEDGLTSYLGDFFNESSQTNAALTAKIFGGTPKKDVDIMEFLSGMDPSYKEVKPSKDYEPIMHLYVIRANLTSNTQGTFSLKNIRLSNGWFLDQVDTEKVLEPLFENGFKLMVCLPFSTRQ